MRRGDLAALVCAALAALAVRPPPVRAQPAREPSAFARELFAQGKRYFDVADYARAIEVWKQAYVAQASPILLFNIAQAYRLAGDCPNAARFYASYERELPQPPNAAELAQAKALCASKPAPPVVVPPVLASPPTTTAELGRADLDAAPDARPPALRAPDPGRGLQIAALASGGAGLALVVTGLIFGSRARADAATVGAYRGVWTPSEASVESAGQTASTIAVVTTSFGIATLLAAPALYYLGAQRGRGAHLGVALAPGHTELTWAARF